MSDGSDLDEDLGEMNHSTRYSPRRGPGDFMISNRRRVSAQTAVRRATRGAVEGEGRDVLLPRATRRRRNAQTSHGGDTVWASRQIPK